MIEISRCRDARQFLVDAGEWLYQSEAEHTLILGIAQRLVDFPDSYEPPIYFAILREQGMSSGVRTGRRLTNWS